MQGDGAVFMLKDAGRICSNGQVARSMAAAKSSSTAGR
jgi:hypothetical protein